MKKTVICILLVCFFKIEIAAAITYDFNTLSQGIYSESEFNNFFDGVSFDNNGGRFKILEMGSNQVVDDLYGEFRREANNEEPYRSTIAAFDDLTDYVSITNICTDPHGVSLTLDVYDAGNNRIDRINEYYNPMETQDGFQPLSFVMAYTSSTPNIAYVEFWSCDGNYTQGDGYWDNFTFNKVQPVPEPATLLLLASGFFGLIGRRKLSRS